MPDDLISIIDLGTGSIRNTLFNLKGDIVDFIQYENPFIYPRTGWVEQDTDHWWQILKDTFLGFPEKIRNLISAISVTSQREGIVPVNAAFKPLSNMIVWLDGRAGDEALEIETKLGKEKIYDICGLVPYPVWSLSKILWIKKHRPDIFHETSKFLQAADYFISRLSNHAVSDFSMASRTCMLDVKEKKWSKEILGTFDLNESTLPELVEPGTIIGKINPDVATEFILNPEVKIISGAGDQQAAALGVGAIQQGVISIGIGTSSALSITLDKPLPSKNKDIILNCTAVPGKWEYEPPIWNTGGLVKWFYENILDKKTSYKDILQEVNTIPAGSEGLIILPYFTGSGSPRWNPELRGVIYGLTLEHNNKHILKGIFESIAFEIRFNIDSIKDQVKVNKIILSGGASQNYPLCQTIADVLQVEVHISTEKEASTKGCYILARAALDKKNSIEEISENLKTADTIISPNKKLKSTYDNLFRKYLALGNLFDRNNA